MVAAPDVCMALNEVQNVAFRASSEAIEFRVSDQKWSLPAHIDGTILVKVGDWTTSLGIIFNTDSYGFRDRRQRGFARDVRGDGQVIRHVDHGWEFQATVGVTNRQLKGDQRVPHLRRAS